MKTIVRSQKHLNFIRQTPCLISFQLPSQACHIRVLTDCGTGIKPSDFFTLPFIYQYHKLQGEMGEVKFYKHFGINPFKEVSNLIRLSTCKKVKQHKDLVEEKILSYARIHKD